MADTTLNTEKIVLKRDAISREVLNLVPETIARTYNVFPLELKGNALKIAMANITDIHALEAVESRTKMRVETVAATPDDVLAAIDFHYQTSYGELEKHLSLLSSSNGETTIEEIMPDTAVDAPIAKALTLIIDEAIKARASDIHIQPEEDSLRIRYRIDGTLHERHILPLQIAVPLISRIKILAKMNIADHHRPQDGQLSVKPKDRPAIDIRVGTIPNVHGEMAALRLLDKSKAIMKLPQLGFLRQSYERFEEMLKVPYGMLLVTGPTGAGKTTTLYASLNNLDRTGRNILTIEDPVEYRFKNINQIQVNPRAGLTFASGLRSILRLDPDIILVGEIRDAETANIAVQSALTGHLVLSSIHANDAVGVISRLLDLDIEPFLIASALIGVVAQRMGRRVCPACSEMIEVPVIEQHAFTKETGEEKTHFLTGKGCKSCTNTGFQGRIGFFEIMNISDRIRSMILEDANADQIRHVAIQEGMVPLIKDGMMKVKHNVTTPAEVLRNAYVSD
ncbi:MAG: type II/IV secretion system protein [Dehalococcoidales bacterium]|nr:MAG: type II/IV secretion system protein [Dehalococcoidales bacterium]